MIKLKGLIKEFTEYNFDPMDMYSRNTKNAKAVERTLKKAGFSKVNLGKAQKQVKFIDQNMHRTRGVMFVHIQYHVIEGKDGKKYFIHQTQYHHKEFYQRYMLMVFDRFYIQMFLHCRVLELHFH